MQVNFCFIPYRYRIEHEKSYQRAGKVLYYCSIRHPGCRNGNKRPPAKKKADHFPDATKMLGKDHFVNADKMVKKSPRIRSTARSEGPESENQGIAL